MKLRSISAVGLKGPDFSHQLSDATAIIGPNAAGKTRILQAIRLALGGYLPECGKAPRATWELASGPELEVRVEFDDGTDMHRRFWIEGATIKASLQGSGFPIEPGSIPHFENLPLLNAEAYFELTDSKRTEYVFERIKLPDTYTPAAIIAECQRISFEEAHTEQIELAKSACVEVVRGAFGPADERAGDPTKSSDKPSVQEALALSIETLRTRFSYYNKREKETQGAVTTLAELKLREISVVAAARGVDQEIEKAQGELERISGEKGKLQQKQDEAERTAKRKAQIRKDLAADRIDYPRSIEKLRGQIKEAEGKIARELEPKAREDLVGAISESKDTFSKINAGVAEQKRIISAAQANLGGLEELACCPFCKSKGKGWQAHLEAELKLTIEKASETKVAGEEHGSALDKSIRQMTETLKASDEAARSNREVRQLIDGYNLSIQSHERNQANEEQRRQQLQDELDGLGLLPEEEDLSLGLKTCNDRIVLIRQRSSELQDRKDAETRLQQQLVSAAQAELEHQDAAAHVTVIKAIAKLLKEKREAMIEEAFGGLLKIANKLTEGILKAPLALHENTIGMWIGAKFVPHRVLSGTEKALAYIAIAVALSSTAPLKLVILDEFGRLDEANQLKVLGRLATLVRNDIIDQFIVVGTSLPAFSKDSQLVLEVIEVAA